LFPDDDARALVGHAVHAEEVGLDAWWLGDEGPARDPFTVLAAAATVTTRLRFGVGIANPYSRHPGLTASTAHTVHELSGGRMVLGFGAGGSLALSPFELTADAPVKAVARAVRIARAVGAAEATEGYRPGHAAVRDRPDRAPMEIVIGARGERLNRLASAAADGAFVAGIPPLLYDQVVGWVRSERDIAVSLYPSVAFSDEEADRLRGQMLWAVANAPEPTRRTLGLDDAGLAAAAEALRTGDETPARALMRDDVLRQVLVIGAPPDVGRQLAELVRRHRPVEIGLALGPDDVRQSQEHASVAFAAMRRELDRTGGAA
jgi:5,10-methylenetetrahydromethanopterin reductase